MEPKKGQCTACKKEVAKDAKVCPYCGRKYPAVTNKQAGIGCLGLIVVALVVGALLDIGGSVDNGKDLPPVEVAARANVTVAGDKLQTHIVPDLSQRKFPDSQAALSQGSDSPAFALFSFFLGWQNQAWEEMAIFTQPSWLTNQADPAGILEAWFGWVDLYGAELIEVGQGNTSLGNMLDLQVRVHYGVAPIVKIEDYTVRVVREAGVWGVNPVSAQNLKGAKGLPLEADRARKQMAQQGGP